MIRLLARFWDSFRGSGEAALTVPPMDGAFLHNTAIDDAAIFLASTQPDNLVATPRALYFSSGAEVLRLEAGGKPQTVTAGTAPVTAMSATPDGSIVVARAGSAPVILTTDGRESPALQPGTGPDDDITAITPCPDGSLAYSVGARKISAAEWSRDFLQRGKSGTIWTAPIGGKAERLAAGLPYPNGLIAEGDGTLVVALAWSSSLERIAPDGKRTPVLRNLPAYPARLSPASGGGYWLSCFALRNQMLEFVLRESKYRRLMMEEIAPAHWLAPRLSAEIGPLDPMLEGCTKKGAEIKPWAPSLSWGLVVRLDADFQPLKSLHSRANGTRHGIRSAVEWNGALLAASIGANLILKLPVTGEELQ